jgi:hypothetical protein
VEPLQAASERNLHLYSYESYSMGPTRGRIFGRNPEMNLLEPEKGRGGGGRVKQPGVDCTA